MITEKNNWIILEEIREVKDGKYKYLWKCQCKCEKKTIKFLSKYKVMDGTFKSCGCYRKEYMRTKQTSHGWARKRLYQTYKHMMERCYNEEDQAYKQYGKRGISVCDEWNHFILGYELAFNNFKDWALSTGYTDELTIDRIDNDGNYCPDNCRWTTIKEQSNNRRTNRLYTYNNQTKNIKEWSEDTICVVKYYTLVNRLNSGWPIEKALTIPASLSNKKCNI